MDIGIYVTIFISQLVGLSLALAIFSSLFLKNRIKSYLWLTFIIILLTVVIIRGFGMAIEMGMSLIAFVLGILTIYNVKEKRKNTHIS